MRNEPSGVLSLYFKRSAGKSRVRAGSGRSVSTTWAGGRSADVLVDMAVFDRVTIEPGKMGGQPCIRGHRFTVEHLLNLVGAGWTLEEIQEDFPFIEAGDIQQAIAFASFSVREYHLPVTRSA